jgi:RNA polymerase sigma-70 factor (ECF subfamily)
MEQPSERWLEQLYGLYATSLHRYALRRVDRHTAEEVVAETFVVAWRRFDRVPPENPLPWLYGVARNLIANHNRSDGRRQALTTRLGHSAMSIGEPVNDSGLLDALALLRASDREALLLVAWEGLSTAELATALGCSEVAARARLHRARRRLSALLREPAHLRTTEIGEVSCDGTPG